MKHLVIKKFDPAIQSQITHYVYNKNDFEVRFYGTETECDDYLIGVGKQRFD